ncbi:hypothetical protein BD779DRAFT_1668846 [Infundibulicybe gibba]|nr:hypothetical protein BD779DRAFT_1668846 [Infundibulicybe gibba]
MAPLAGKPPFATDEPDSFYESPAPQRRVRQQPPPDPNKRSSAYDVYDNYIGDDDNNQSNRQSGVGALGMGLLTMDDDDDDDDDDSYAHRKPQVPASVPVTVSSKHAALAAATGVRTNPPSPPPPQQPIAAPRPGYAAPIAALNLARPEQSATPQGRQNQPLQQQNALRINTQAQNPFEPPTQRRAPPSPVPATPHPLQPPITPITPVFARPAKSAASSPGITFSDPKPIMRSNTEETLLPKRGEKGDDFWRRFSMVAKEENKKPYAQKQSSWLKKTNSGASSLSRWVWVVGVLLILTAAGAIGLGWYVSHKTPDHQQPKVFGGSANEMSSALPTTTSAAASGTKTSMHVTPTHTVARRSLHSEAASHRKRLSRLID